MCLFWSRFNVLKPFRDTLFWTCGCRPILYTLKELCLRHQQSVELQSYGLRKLCKCWPLYHSTDCSAEICLLQLQEKKGESWKWYCSSWQLKKIPSENLTNFFSWFSQFSFPLNIYFLIVLFNPNSVYDRTPSHWAFWLEIPRCLAYRKNPRKLQTWLNSCWFWKNRVRIIRLS